MRKKFFLIISLIIVSASSAFAFFTGEISGYIPQPVIKSPRGEVVDIREMDGVTFSWGKHVALNEIGKYYDFRLYEGTESTKSGVLFIKKVPGNIHAVTVPSEKFENGGIYTWTLRLCYRSIGKSNRVICTFEIVK